MLLLATSSSRRLTAMVELSSEKWPASCFCCVKFRFSLTCLGGVAGVFGGVAGVFRVSLCTAKYREIARSPRAAARAAASRCHSIAQASERSSLMHAHTDCIN